MRTRMRTKTIAPNVIRVYTYNTGHDRFALSLSIYLYIDANIRFVSLCVGLSTKKQSAQQRHETIMNNKVIRTLR